MRYYNTQYEKYYKNLGIRDRKGTKHTDNNRINTNLGNGGISGYGNINTLNKGRGGYGKKESSISIIPNFGTKNPGKTIIFQLVGTLLLFTIIIGCKVIKTSETAYAYEYGKKVVSENYDYKNAIDYVKNYDYKSINISNLKEFKIDGINSSVSTYLDKFKVKLGEFTSARNVIEKNYMIPCNGNILYEFNKEEDKCFNREVHKGLDIACNNSDVVATNSGRVKEVGDFNEGGKYIIMDHGNGIESKYYFLKEVNVDIEQAVNIGDVVGKGAQNKDGKNDFIHFEITYMGEEKNPLEFVRN
ncbi:M23 family metallopeptidase [Clostridium frigidicarnis]|uniref:Peptidase family M23 n=1 Tax=Clostridium frigidicarnis TaxID=84698 RepID=A0A1I0YST7_9CLOT|nr:M23 family metallopeptidase [Clostridium frigidicarnis]SFB16364.1 Peptidase family M23 [Clostridium frigidicarnis]